MSVYKYSSSIGFYIDTTTLAYKRVTIAGFTIKNLKIVPNSFRKTGLILSFQIKCVCGRGEYIACDYVNLFGNNGKAIDVAKILEDTGAVSRTHLRADGYSEAEINYIRRAYDDDKTGISAHYFYKSSRKS